MSPQSTKPKDTTREWCITLSAIALVCAGLALPQPATAQQGFLSSGDARMRIKSDGVDYDYTDHQFAVVGNVQIYYKRATIEADRVVYDQFTKRLRAEGNARLTEANGKVTIGQVIDLTDDYRDGFVDALGVETVAPRRAAHQPHRRRSPQRQ
jgi:LPS-assembly protein